MARDVNGGGSYTWRGGTKEILDLLLCEAYARRSLTRQTAFWQCSQRDRRQTSNHSEIDEDDEDEVRILLMDELRGDSKEMRLNITLVLCRSRMGDT